MRYAYVKNGDAVDQVARLSITSNHGPSSGPDAFIYDLLINIKDQPTIVISKTNTNKHYKNNNIEARSLKCRESSFARVFDSLISFLNTLYYLVKFKPDFVICGTMGSMLWSSFIAAKLQNKYFIHSRHSRIEYFGNNILKKLLLDMDNFVIRRANAVVCHGPYLKQQLMGIGVSPNKIFEFDIHYHKMQISTNQSTNIEGVHDNNYILYIGRMEADKGIFDLLTASEDLLNKNPKLSLLYVGGGSSLQELSKQVKNRSLTNKVKLLGYVEHGNLVNIIQNSMFLVTPTQKMCPEGRCMSAVEGLIQGVPVIAPKFGPFPFLIQDGENGLLYEIDSVLDLKEKIVSLVENSEFRNLLSKGAKMSASELLHPDLTFGQAVSSAARTCLSK